MIGGGKLMLDYRGLSLVMHRPQIHMVGGKLMLDQWSENARDKIRIFSASY
jgi:hypothetical protein